MTHTKRAQAGDRDPCRGCMVATRRQFLLDAARLAADALVVLGATSEQAAALSLRFVRPERARARVKDYAIPPVDGVSIDDDESVIIARYAGAVYAFSLACPHQNTALRWDADRHAFRCPKHHSTYTPDGIFIQGRATRSMDRFAVMRAGANVGVDFDQLYRQDDDPTLWKAAFIQV